MAGDDIITMHQLVFVKKVDFFLVKVGSLWNHASFLNKMFHSHFDILNFVQASESQFLFKF